MDAKPARVVLFGHLGSGNFGNDATLATMLSWVRQSGGPDPLAIVYGPEIVQQLMVVDAISMHGDRSNLAWLPKPVRGVLGKLVDLVHITRALHPDDVVLVPGSGVFEEVLAPAPWGLGLSLLSVRVAAALRGAKLGFVGIGAAYQQKWIVRWMTRRTLAYAQFLTVRDEPSRHVDVFERIRSVDVVIGSRYHNLVFALLEARPVLALGYSSKCDALLCSVGLDPYVLRMQEATVDDLIKRFTMLTDNLPQTAELVDRYRRKAAVATARHRDQVLGFLDATRPTDPHGARSPARDPRVRE